MSTDYRISAGGGQVTVEEIIPNYYTGSGGTGGIQSGTLVLAFGATKWTASTTDTNNDVTNYQQKTPNTSDPAGQYEKIGGPGADTAVVAAV